MFKKPCISISTGLTHLRGLERAPECRAKLHKSIPNAASPRSAFEGQLLFCHQLGVSGTVRGCHGCLCGYKT